MKKSGCFFTAIISITIVIGIIFYIGKKYAPEIWEYGKERLLTIAEKDIKEKIAEVRSSEYKDSLIVLVNSKLERLKELSFEEMDKDSSQFFDKVKEFVEDKVIDSDEILKLTELYKEYEKQ